VASEVRSLAQRSAEAAKEIKTLISNSVEQVEQGTALVDQAGESMQEIVTAIKRVSDIVAEISAASVEQSTGVGQVEEAVSQMDQATQQNAALVEESAAAAESLKQQAQQLVQAVSVFKINAQSHGTFSHAAARDSQPVVAHAAALGRSEGAPIAAPVDRRGPNRAVNVTRPAFGSKAPPKKAVEAPPQPPMTAKEPVVTAKNGTDDWESF
jgi:methyl-accepting chemotaxis protein